VLPNGATAPAVASAGKAQPATPAARRSPRVRTPKQQSPPNPPSVPRRAHELTAAPKPPLHPAARGPAVVTVRVHNCSACPDFILCIVTLIVFFVDRVQLDDTPEPKEHRASKRLPTLTVIFARSLDELSLCVLSSPTMSDKPNKSNKLLTTRTIRVEISWNPERTTLATLRKSVQHQANLCLNPDGSDDDGVSLTGRLQARGNASKRPQPFTVLLTDDALIIQLSKPGGVRKHCSSCLLLDSAGPHVPRLLLAASSSGLGGLPGSRQL
jgi:hypothetical protein